MTATIERTTTVAIPHDVATSEISDRAFRLYVLLRAHEGPLGSQQAIADRYGLSQAYVSRAMCELAHHGLLATQNHRRGKYDFPAAG